ncbi:adhesion G protein-coupled receptor G3 isoform X2 [Amia ocellicauda]
MKYHLLNNMVIGVNVGNGNILNLTDPVKIIFKHNNESNNGNCSYWSSSKIVTKNGSWLQNGCNTNKTREYFICSCNHLSFFAILMVDVVGTPPKSLVYITYAGSGISVLFTAVTMILFLCFRKRRSEHSLLIHIHLNCSLFLLHLFFLLNVGLANSSGQMLCWLLGVLLHWALLCCFTWKAIEGFHLYMLLVKVYNIYVHRYMLKLCCVGWGVPTVIVVTCASVNKYGQYNLGSDQNHTSADMCWISDKTVHYITIIGYFSVIALFNTVMLSIVAAKLCRRRQSSLPHERRQQLWKDCPTVLGLSCVLGLPWALGFFGYGPMQLIILYLFTIFNSFQGLFLFLWVLALLHHLPTKEDSSKKSKTEGSTTT